MTLANKQREAIIIKKGNPRLRLEFDVFTDGHISMWTHFDHNDSFIEVEKMLLEIKNHLQEFIKDKPMCPFHIISKE